MFGEKSTLLTAGNTDFELCQRILPHSDLDRVGVEEVHGIARFSASQVIMCSILASPANNIALSIYYHHFRLNETKYEYLD